jgi:hypothetical protein
VDSLGLVCRADDGAGLGEGGEGVEDVIHGRWEDQHSRLFWSEYQTKMNYLMERSVN